MTEPYSIALINIGGAIFAAFIGAIATLWAVRLQRPRKIIRVARSNSTILSANRVDRLPGVLKVIYDNKEIEKLVSVRLLVRNVGNVAIHDIPFRWITESEGVILDAPPEEGSDLSPFGPIKITRPSEKKKILEGTIKFINAGEVISISMLATNDIVLSQFDSRAPDLTIKYYEGLNIYAGYTFVDFVNQLGAGRLAVILGVVAGVAAVLVSVMEKLEAAGGLR